MKTENSLFESNSGTYFEVNGYFIPNVIVTDQSKLVPLEEVPSQVSIDFVVCCPKCKRQYAMVRVIHAPIIPFEILPSYTAAT